jgi:multidrug resistance efflux pump
MEILLLAVYSFFVWLIFFKFKWLRWTTAAAVVVVTIPIIGLAALMLLLNVVAPSALDVQVVKYVVQVIPRVTGRVVEVPVEPNRLVRRGDLLFRIDPRPFQYEVDRLRALLASTAGDVAAQRQELRASEEQIEVSGNRVRSLASSIDATRAACVH